MICLPDPSCFSEGCGYVRLVYVISGDSRKKIWVGYSRVWVHAPQETWSDQFCGQWSISSGAPFFLSAVGSGAHILKFHEWSERRFGPTARATFHFHVGCPGQLYRLLPCTWYFTKIKDDIHPLHASAHRAFMSWRIVASYSYQKVRRRIGLCLLSLPFNMPL